MRAIDRLLRNRPKAGGLSLAGKIKALFANGEQGWWYDPSNFATLFQDRAGTTPVTAVEQPVGLQLDLSKQQSWIDVTGAVWTKTSGDGVVTVNGNQITITGATTTTTVTRTAGNIPLVSGTARMQIRANWTSATGALVWLRGVPVVPVNGVSTLRGESLANSNLERLDVSTGTITFTIESFQYWAGNHRFQSTSANRPVVSARVNLLTKTEQFADAVWAVQGATKTTGVLAPDGTTTAVTIAITSNTGNNLTQLLAGLPSESRIATAMVKGTAGQQVFFAADDSTPQTLVTFTGDWQTVSNTQTASGNVYFVFEIFNRSGGAALPNVTFSMWHPDLRSATQGVGLPAYQRVNTSTDYDSTGFPVYIKPNGSNQSMQTNSINFSATDKMTVWQGVRKLSDAGTSMILELGTNAYSAPGFNIMGPRDGLDDSYGFALYQTASTGYKAEPFPSPITSVLSCLFDYAGATVSDEIKPRVNGAIPSLTVQTASPAGTGNFGTYPAYFYMRVGVSLPFSGHDYGSIARGAASTAAQITAGETYINSKTKAY